MLGYEAHHELSLFGKLSPSNSLICPAQSCTRIIKDVLRVGVRDGVKFNGMDEWDGAITGAPARCVQFSVLISSYSQSLFTSNYVSLEILILTFAAVQHLYSNVVEQTIGYYPPPCELDKITSETTAFCDALEGRVDGVVSRSDLCKLNFNLNSTIGKSYSYAASSGMSPAFMGPPGGGPPKT